jgi:hypothetical protein
LCVCRSNYRTRAVAAAAALEVPGCSPDAGAFAAAAQQLQDVLQWDPLDTHVIQALERVRGLQQQYEQDQEQRGLLLDPITQELVCDPVWCSDGYTYDRFTILNQEGGVMSPFDGQQLQITGVDYGVSAALPVEQREQQRVRRYVWGHWWLGFWIVSAKSSNSRWQ